MDDLDLTADAFLGGRLRIFQPKNGYRAATDPVLLAAAVPAKPGETVLELGIGTGVASLCLAARVPGLSLTGVELQPEHVAIARRNADENQIPLEIYETNLENMPRDVLDRVFDHVIANPPYHVSKWLTPPASRTKAISHASGEETITIWIKSGLRRLKPGGVFSLIHRAEALPEILRNITPDCGDLDVIPIASRINRPAGRVVVRGKKGRIGPLKLHPPFVLHEGTEHRTDGDDYSDAAKAVLRHGNALR